MIRNLLVLTINDLAIAFKNKTIYLILFIPLFVFMVLNFIDRADVDPGPTRMGLIKNHGYTPQILQSITAAENLFELSWVEHEQQGREVLKAKTIDGLLLVSPLEADSLTLLVLKKESVQTLAIVERLAALQKATQGTDPNWLAAIETPYSADLQQQTLPTWTLMIVLLIGFIILPAQIAEEKEKKLLLALLQTPIHELQWLLAKVLTGMILTLIAILVLHLLGGFGVAHLFDYLAFLLVGGFCFSAYGILIGFLCHSQASARTLGVVFYLPHLLPSALSDFSQQLTAIAPLLPSYQLYEPLKSILLEDGRIATMSFEWVYLCLVGSFTFYLSYVLMKKRWLMRS